MEADFFLLAGIIILFLVIFLSTAIKIINPSQKGLVERMGKLIATKESGVHIIIPFIDTLRRVDIRERAIDVPPQDVICKDNVSVTVDCIVYLQVIDPKRAIYNVTDFIYAVVKLAQTNLRSVIGQMSLDETLSSRETINNQLRKELDESTDVWGVKVQRVEVQRVDPPQDVVKAMHQQMKAEREKRASILTAEGQKRSEILEAEGKKNAAILNADGERQSYILIAEGKAKALELESNAAIKYFKEGAVIKEQLKVFENSMNNNTKFVLGSDLMDNFNGFFKKFN